MLSYKQILSNKVEGKITFRNSEINVEEVSKVFTEDGVWV